jgi:hypothetical protein
MVNKLGPSRGAGERKRKGDPLRDLRRHLDGLRLGKTPRDRESRRIALARFVGGLSSDERTYLRRDWLKSPRSTQAALHAEICNELGGIGGPAETLLRELREDRDRQLDGLPEPPAISAEKSAEEWEAILIRDGLPAEKAKEVAVELAKPLNESTKDFWIASGATPELAAEMAAQDRRNQKWSAVADETLPAVLAAKERNAWDELRPIARESASLAKRMTDDALRLAWCLDRFTPGQRRGSEARRAAVKQLRSAVVEGETLSDVIAALSQVTDALAVEMAALDEELARPVGGQAKDLARDTARKLKARGLTLKQITEVLVTQNLVPDWYVAEHTRDLLRKTPASGPTPPPREGKP